MTNVAIRPRLMNAGGLSWQKLGPERAESDPLVVMDGDARGYYYPSDMALYVEEVDSQFERGPHRGAEPPELYDKIVPQAVVILLTESCNFACEYCYVMGSGRGESAPAPIKTIDAKTVCRAIDLCGGDPMDVRFFGGEPLMAWPALEWAVERAEAKATYLHQKARPKFHVTTNGSLLTEEKLEFLREKGFSILISLDGPQHIHDAARKYHDGRGTYESVLRALDLIRKTGMANRVTLRSTFTPDLTEVDVRLEHLNDLCDQGYASGVAVEPAVGCGGVTCRTISAEYTPRLIRKALDKGLDYCISRALTGNRARWAYLNKALQRLMERMPAFSECGAGKGYVAVLPSGEIHVCHKSNYPIGSFPEGIQEEKVTPWIENRLSSRKDCSACWARFICGGGCRAEGVEEGIGVCHGTVGCMVSKQRAALAIAAAVQLRNNPEALERMYMKRTGRPK